MNDVYDMCQMLSANFAGRRVKVGRVVGKLLGVYALDFVHGTVAVIAKVPMAVIRTDADIVSYLSLSENDMAVIPSQPTNKETT